MTRLIVVGAKDPNDMLNNVRQAAHADLVRLSQLYKMDVVCYDVAYSVSQEIDGVKYINENYFLGDTDQLCKDSLNIIIEFCNFLDENFINHNGYGCLQYENLMRYSGYKIAILSCGCGWSQGFPSECVEEIVKNNLITPYDAYSIYSLLYVISTVQFLKEQGIVAGMQPYLMGIYRSIGTLMWRGCAADSYFSEGVVRELFEILGTDMVPANDSNELQSFVDKSKHWNQLKWSLRKQLNEYIYGLNPSS
jgi:hypothetical protein